MHAMGLLSPRCWHQFSSNTWNLGLRARCSGETTPLQSLLYACICNLTHHLCLNTEADILPSYYYKFLHTIPFLYCSLVTLNFSFMIIHLFRLILSEITFVNHISLENCSFYSGF